MNTHAARIKNNHARYWIVSLVLAAAVFFGWSSHADARIVVEGDADFRRDVEECISIYRNTEGIVGEVIQELENSTNEHRITQSPDWSNAPNDGADASNGTGTGTVTRVDKDELENYKERFEELRNKDFCTALLHELWHAVDADRGEWTSDDLDGVNRGEVEATIFQNFVHAIRGVDPRTQYGGVDISRHLGLSAEEAGATTGGSGTGTETATEPAAPPSTGATTAPPSARPKIRIIQYAGKYLPVDQLIVESEGDCGDHYHAASGVVTATDGAQLPDPGPPCGYGAVATTPVLEIEQ